LKDQVSKIFQTSICLPVIDGSQPNGSRMLKAVENSEKLALVSWIFQHSLAVPVVGIITRTIALQIHILPTRANPNKRLQCKTCENNGRQSLTFELTLTLTSITIH